VFLIVLLGLAPALAAPEKVSPEQIDKLVGQLGSKSFGERERAMEALDKLGLPALEALRKATRSRDSEVSRRAGELVERIEKRGTNSQMLAPTRVRLVCKDMPVADAVAELSRKSGYRIVLTEPNKLQGRKITLDTGETTFWQAFDQLCDKAGLVETSPQFAGFPGGPMPRPAIRRGAAGGAAQPAGPLPGPAQAPPGGAPVPPPLPSLRLPYGPMGTPGQLFVTGGKPVHLPTSYAGAVRVRALPRNDSVSRTLSGEGEIPCLLEAYPEPKLPSLSVVSVQVEKAVDDQGQNLSQSVGERSTAKENTPEGPPARVVVSPYGRGARAVALLLKKGDKESKSLKELKGSISAQIRTAPQPIFTVDKVLKSAGQTTKGKDGGWLKVLEVGRDDKDVVTLRVELEIPEGLQPAAGPITPLNATAPLPPVPAATLPGGGRPVRRGPAYCAGLAMFDAKGQPLQLTATRVQMRAGVNVLLQEYTFRCQLERGQEGPAKLVYFAARLAGVDIPFDLQDVPLR
jgi:hypothetical protein